MTEEQFNHYIKGGKFKAIYTPASSGDIGSNMQYINKEVIVNQNMINSPLQSPEKWIGQHAFNADLINGWLPEEDISNLQILDEFIEVIESTPIYLYRLTYTDSDSLEPNFGNGAWQVPFVVTREYSSNQDTYVLKLSDPQANKIEKAIWRGIYGEKFEWEILLEQTKDKANV